MPPPIDLLKQKGRTQLANVLERFGTTPVQNYSAQLYDYEAICPIEPELLDAFRQEIKRVQNYSYESTVAPEIIVQELEKYRILQTSTHLTASEGPSFFAIHWLASLGLPVNRPYLIGAFSGIPFSNSAWSGCLNYSARYRLEDLLGDQSPLFKELFRAEKDRGRDTEEQRISLIPGKTRDGLVFRASTFERMSQLFPYLCEPIQTILPPTLGDSFTKWALGFCQNQMNQLFPEKNFVYLDLNEIISQYLQSILEKTDHPVFQILFEPGLQPAITQAFGEALSFFMAPYPGKYSIDSARVKREKLLPLRRTSNQLYHPQCQIPLTPEAIQDALKADRLCPGTFLTFMILSFLNGIKCLGSYGQVEYLEKYRQGWLQVGLLDESVVRTIPTNGLTSGRFLDAEGHPIFPLDVILGTPWEFPEKITLQELLDPLLPRL